MARFKDVLPSAPGWIHELARAETHPDAERFLNLGQSFDPHQLVEEGAIEFLTELREQFSECTRVFNALSEAATKFQEIKVYSLAQSAVDFMAFRNGVKLVIANTAHGVIQISFAQHVWNASAVSVDGQTTGPTPIGPAQELLAQVGPFRDIAWTFQGEKVTAEQVARFYFAEFARITRETRRSSAGNQLLLNQIKALLQEKGLDL